jgi:hypothetical protein
MICVGEYGHNDACDIGLFLLFYRHTVHALASEMPTTLGSFHTQDHSKYQATSSKHNRLLTHFTVDGRKRAMKYVWKDLNRPLRFDLLCKVAKILLKVCLKIGLAHKPVDIFESTNAANC